MAAFEDDIWPPRDPRFDWDRSDRGDMHNLPTDPLRFIALDVETANQDVGSICQIGIAMVDHANQITTASFLIDPGVEFFGINIRIHGITPEMVERAPTFAQVMDAILPRLQRQPVFQHSRFDEKACGSAAARCGIDLSHLIWCDSVVMARRAWPEFRGNGGHGLGHLKTALGLNFAHHDAEEDARASAEVVLRAEARIGVEFYDVLGL